MPRNRPSIRDWMIEYNRLARIATERGLGVREYRNLRVSNDEARARVETLAARLGTPLLIGSTSGQVPDPLAIQAPTATPRIRTLRPRRSRRRFGAYPSPSYTPAPMVSAISCNYPDQFEFDDMTFGIEIECLPPRALRSQEIAQQFETAGLRCVSEGYNHATRDWWKLTTDRSVMPTGNQGAQYRGDFEVVSPKVPGRDFARQVGLATGTLNALPAQVNKTCGLHIHIGLSPQQDNVGFFKRLVGHMSIHENHIDSLVAPSRRGNAAFYCQSIAPYKGRIDEATTVQEVIRRAPGKFFKLNLVRYSDRGTVEFRQHQGTTDPVKIEKWARLCALIFIASSRGIEPQPVATLGEFLTQINCPAGEREYYLARAQELTQRAGAAR